jgi:hypothetical protein
MATLRSFKKAWFRLWFSANVRVEMIGYLIGSYELLPWLSGPPICSVYLNSYCNYWMTTIGNIAESVGTAWWGPCPFFSWCSVVFRLPLPMQVDKKKWTSCGRLRSPADSYLWSHLVGIVYAQCCNLWDELWNAIEAAGMTVCNMPDVLQWTRGSWCSGAVCMLTVMVDHVSSFFCCYKL